MSEFPDLRQPSAFDPTIKVGQTTPNLPTDPQPVRETAKIAELQEQLAALSWTWITLENLPKMGDMVLIFDGDYCVDNVLQPFANGKKNQLKGWKNIGASHRRPINPPPPPGEEAVKP